MPRRTNAFQQLIALLTGTLAGRARVTESAMLIDTVTHEEREVDILISASAADYNISIGIEVVGRSRKAGAPWIESMRGKHANLPVDKLVLVSESGFTAPALVKARFYGIETLTIERALHTDWPMLAALEATGIFEVTTLYYDCAAICRHSDGRQEQVVAPLQAPLQIGNHSLAVGEFANQLLSRSEFRNMLAAIMKNESERNLWAAYTDPSGIWKIEDDGSKTQIEEMRIGLRVLRHESVIEFTSGLFRGTPFVAGTTTLGASPLRFVLTRRQDGAEQGLLVDTSGLRSLTSFPSEQA